MTEALEAFRYADAARTLYDFAWDEFCSFTSKWSKDRFGDPQRRPVAQRVLAWALDQLLRLLHPMIPFIYRRNLGVTGTGGAPSRTDSTSGAFTAVDRRDLAAGDLAWQDEPMERRFALFQAVLGAVREIRSRQNIPPKAEIAFRVRCEREKVEPTCSR